MRLIEFIRSRAQQVSRGFLVPFAPGNPMQMKEPYDMFYRVGPYVPGWHRQGNFGTVERIPPKVYGATTPAVTGQAEPPKELPQHGVIPSIRPLAEKGEPYTFHQRMPASEDEPWDFSFRGQIGAPRHHFRMGESQHECYDFTY